MRFPPEAYLIGAQKSGTTTLAYLLDQHPLITLPRTKEPHFFTHNWDAGLDWYREKFDGAPPDSVLLDASTTYSMASLEPRGSKGRLGGVPERVFSVNPHARFIYLLRDPVERTYSAHWHGVRKGHENRDFGTLIRNNSLRLDISDYHGQLLLWLDYFPLDSFRFVLFEDMKESPERAARECFEFLLGKDADVPSVRLDSVKNPSYIHSRMGRGLNRLARRTNRLFARHPGLARSLTSSLAPVVPKAVKSGVRDVRRDEPLSPMKKEDRDFLVKYFYERNRKLEHLIGVPLDKWQT